MQHVVIDMFTVPEEAKPSFFETARVVQGFLKTLPGFVEGFVYEKTDGDSNFNVMTTAVWESEQALENAKEATIVELGRRNLRPQEIMKALKIEMQRAVYLRSPY